MQPYYCSLSTYVLTGSHELCLGRWVHNAGACRICQKGVPTTPTGHTAQSTNRTWMEVKENYMNEVPEHDLVPLGRHVSLKALTLLLDIPSRTLSFSALPWLFSHKDADVPHIWTTAMSYWVHCHKFFWCIICMFIPFWCFDSTERMLDIWMLPVDRAIGNLQNSGKHSWWSPQAQAWHQQGDQTSWLAA
jgi:hypothetical protein